MSGSGRKSHYRKSVTDQFLNGFPLPTENEKVVRTLNSRGTNIFEVSTTLSSFLGYEVKQVELDDGSTELALLPNKFKKLIWIKRGDFLIVSNTCGEALEPASSVADGCNPKVKFLINHILSREQVKHVKTSGMWYAMNNVPKIIIIIRPESFRIVESKDLRRDVDVMPDYDSMEEYEEDEEEETDKMGNTIIP